MRDRFGHIFSALSLPLALSLVVLMSGCASTGSKSSAGLVSVSYSDIPSAAEELNASESLETTIEPAENSLEVVEDPLVDTGQPLTGGAALDRALELAEEGLLLYRGDDHEGAREALRAARILLLAADLPEAMQERGLAVLSCALPGDLNQYDLEAIIGILELEEDLEPDADQRQVVEREVRRILLRFGAPTPEDGFLQTFVDEVERYIEYYRGSQREFFERSFTRKHKYWPTIEAVFNAKNIPIELGYMALVESGYNPRARSHANARGLWQFIPSTGKRYGLRHTNDFYDVLKATEAASEYLLDLIGIFGSESFLLATAAYNAGEGRIQGCLRKLEDPFGKRNFWEIRDCLARETREYVPRIMAAAVIGTNPGRYGFDLPNETEMRQRYDVVTIPNPTSLREIARLSGIGVADLRAANSDLSTTATTTPSRNFPLYVPRGGGEQIASIFSANPSASANGTTLRQDVTGGESRDPGTARSSRTPQVTTTPIGPDESATWFEYVVRAGDTLGGIASTFSISVSDLKRWNPILNQRVLLRGERIKIYPPSGGQVERQVYRVKSGDTLSDIATRFGLDYRQVAQWNSLRSPYRLKIGQRLTLYPRGSAPSRMTYTVQRGNTLQTIAEIFEVRYRDVMRWNDLRRSTLQVGQKLILHPPRAFEATTYRVKRGDTVARIARRMGVPAQDILTANGLGRRTVIRPGQNLLIYRPL